MTSFFSFFFSVSFFEQQKCFRKVLYAVSLLLRVLLKACIADSVHRMYRSCCCCSPIVALFGQARTSAPRERLVLPASARVLRATLAAVLYAVLVDNGWR